MSSCLVLYGRSNTGKTGTLMKLMDLIKSKGYLVINSTFPIDSFGDRRIITEIKGKRIGITSRGDTRAVLEEDYMWAGECDWFICASRTKGQTEDFINKSFSTILWQKRWQVLDDKLGFSFSALYDESQMNQAKMILELLENILLK